MEQPTGTVTFLFTDLEGSTRLWDEHPDAMHEAMARHDTILRDAIETASGYLVKSTGDGVHGSFATAEAAATAAIAAQRALFAEPWGATGPLRVRIGLHTGSAEARDGDYYGPALNRAARLMAAAHGGQVVCSEVTADILRDELYDEVDLVDLGEHRLPDLGRPEHVFQVRVPGLVEEFPPLRSLDAIAGNLPLQTTSFVGRAVELEEIDRLLASSRLVTLTGVGGVGKTRLAIEVATAAAAEHRDGAWLCELAVADDADAALQIVAGVLGAGSRVGLALHETIVDFLRIKDLLLVLDNCEHLLDDVSELAEAISAECSKVRILATSREALGVIGEHVVRVRSLPTPDASAGDPTDLATIEAVELFMERAAAAGAGFVLGPHNAAAVAEICRRLDGIPLALELAAARTSVLQPADIAARLDERFRLLTGRRRGALERHQALRATVDWSYSLLDEREGQVFRRLGVFPGTFDADGAAAVASARSIGSADVLEALDSLVAKSMVNLDASTAGTTRYQMLETLRQYAREELEAVGETDATRRAHAEHFVALAERIGPGLASSDELAWRVRLIEELDNLRAVVGWSLDSERTDDHELAIRTVTVLELEANAGQAYEIGAWAQRTLPFVGSATPAQRSAVQTAAGWRALNEGDVDRARRLADLALSTSPRERRAPANAYVLRGLVYAVAGDIDEGLLLLRNADAQLDALGVKTSWDMVIMATVLPSFSAIAGQLDDVARLGEEAIRVARELGNPTSLAAALFPVAIALRDTEPDRARALVDESIELVRSGASGLVFGHSLAVRCQLRADAGDREGAILDLREAVEYGHDKGDRPMLAVVVDRGTEALTKLGEVDAAARFVGIGRSPSLAGLSSLPKGEHARYGVALGRIEEELGADRLSAIIAEISTMTYDQAVSAALADLDRLVEAGS